MNPDERRRRYIEFLQARGRPIPFAVRQGPDEFVGPPAPEPFVGPPPEMAPYTGPTPGGPSGVMKNVVTPPRQAPAQPASADTATIGDSMAPGMSPPPTSYRPPGYGMPTNWAAAAQAAQSPTIGDLLAKRQAMADGGGAAAQVGEDFIGPPAITGTAVEPEPEAPAKPEQKVGWLKRFLGNDPNESREKRLYRMEGLRGAAESMGGLGTSMRRASMIGIGKDPRAVQPFVAEGIRGRIDKLEDELTEDEAATLGRSLGGVEIPRSMGFSRLEKLLPTVASALRARDVAADREEHQAWTREQREQEEARRREVAERLSEREDRELRSLEEAIDLAESIARDKSQYDTGLLANLWHSSWDLVGMSDPAKAEFKSRLLVQLNKAIRDQTGAVLSPGEVQRITPTLPQMYHNDEQFMARLKPVIARLKRAREQFLNSKEAAGKNVSALRDVSAPLDGGEEIPVVDPDGNAGTIPAEDWPEAEKQGYKRR